MVGGETTGWIGGRGVAREVKRLAPAAAEVDASPLAAPAGLGHPALAAEGAEPCGVTPNVAERMLPYGLEAEPGQRVSGVTRKREPVGAQHDEATTPAVHAGLGQVRVVVRRDEEHLHLPPQASSSLRRHPPCPRELL